MSGLPRRIAEWYASGIAVLLPVALIPIGLLVFQVGPSSVLAAFTLVVGVAIAALFTSLLARSEFVYEFFTEPR